MSLTRSDADVFLGRWWDELWGEGRVQLVEELVAERHRRHSASGTRIVDREEFKIELVQHQRVLHRPVTTVEAMAITGDVIWTRAVSRGVNLETGEPFSVSWLQQQRLVEGQLVESWALTATGTDWAPRN